jgi:negative regulator of flagellin synthesis FlgM
MKIDNSLKSVGNAGSDNRTGSNGKAGKADTTPQGPGVSVELGSQLKSLETRIAGVDVVDTAKVSEIKQAISEGRFQVNPDVIADRLLQTAQDLIRAYKLQ